MAQQSIKLPISRDESMHNRVLNWLSPSRRNRYHYSEYLTYQHRNFDVKGLTTQGIYTLELEDVFIDLGLGPQTPDGAASTPIRPMPKALREGRHSIWEYLSSQQLKDHNLVVVGPPGSGKTTLLKYIALHLVSPSRRSAQAAQVDKLPILLFLRDYAALIREDPQYTLLQAVQDNLAKWDNKIPADWFEMALKKQHCLVMLDGLDEVADVRVRWRVVAWVEQQMARYHGNRFIVTSRPFGYRDNPLRDATVLEVHPFTIEQVERFVHNWYLANEVMSAQRDDPGVRMTAHEGAEDLLWRLRRAHVLLDMSVNPLLLTMIATVHRYRSSLPGRRVELYTEICEVFLGKRQQARGLPSDLTPAQKQRVLQPLAYTMMCQQRREIRLAEAVAVIDTPLDRVSPQTSGEAFLKMIENTSGLLIEREAGLYSFSHLTFQEYLAAVHVSDQKLENTLLKQVENSWWHETIRLYAAQADATNIIKACLSRSKPSIMALTLAMECLEEAREVRPELRNIFDRLEQSVEHNNPEVRRVAAEVLLTLRLRRMVRVDEDKFEDNSCVSHAEYQLFVDEVQASGDYRQPDHWFTGQFPENRGRDPIAGVRPLDAVAFCEWLTLRDQGEWQYRIPGASEVGVLKTILQFEPVNGIGYWFASDNGFECTKFDMSDPAAVTKALKRLGQRFANDQALDRELNHQSPIMGRARNLILGRARHRVFTLLDFDRDLEVIRAYSPTIVDDLNRVRDRQTMSIAKELDRLLGEALARVQNPNLAHAREIDLEEIVELVEVLALKLDQAKDFDVSPGFARSVLNELSRAQHLSGNREQILQQEMIRALNSVLAQVRDLIFELNRCYVEARTRTRVTALRQVVALLGESGTQQQSDSTRVREQKTKILKAYIDLYLDFAILEERLANRLPALEGIRLVKVRKQPVV